MKRITRLELSAEAQQNLNDAQQKCDKAREAGTLKTSGAWKNFRAIQKGAHYHMVRSALEGMSGKFETCMYCEVSEGGQVEHFWPKEYSHKLFVWENLLLCCSVCGSDYKGNTFPLCDKGAPLLINPTEEDPWDYLHLDLETFILTARFLRSEEGQIAESPKGQITTEVLGFAEREGLQERYKGNHFDLADVVREAMVTEPLDDEDMIKKLKSADKYCFLGWYLRGTGGDEPPFLEFRQKYPDFWDRLKREIQY